ncbi:Peptidyl-prolyl cis-trans isomerase CWC27 like protein [Eufriesea mexicana]|uniref:Peptidyl-prolyl cis-trans isomerase n=1 Tax=Eufriesea mexicana TaxID=516756 RepID=A0A310SG19_9HYME|nr:Peptidyl-prolyl cis-trans isomerase CWC27 like protein [Eufriesea mexicana]
MKTTVGDVELELQAKETPKTYRNFIQLCVEGYYHDTIFHRIIQGFVANGGALKGTGGGRISYKITFLSTRVNYCGRDNNDSQFYFTLGSTSELENKHTIFGMVTEETIYNMLKLKEALVDEEINFNLLSFVEKAKENEEESAILNKKSSGKSKSAHDHSTDPKLNS